MVNPLPCPSAARAIKIAGRKYRAGQTGQGMGRAFVIGGLVAAALAGPALAQNTFKSGNWSGGPSFTGKDFSHCYVSVSFVDGAVLMFQLTAKMEMYLGASKSGWNMDPTKQYD